MSISRIDGKLDQKGALLAALGNQFTISNKQGTFYSFSMCNEIGFPLIISALKSIRISCTNQVKVALLFGESNFISLMPVLSEFCDVIVLADIEPNVHIHNMHLLNCLKHADTPDDFMEIYRKNYPPELTDDEFNADYMCYNMRLGNGANMLERYYFLNSQKAYTACKNALAKIDVTQIQLDLSDVKSCAHLAEVLKENNACFTLCNFTNIHHYVGVIPPVASLLANSKNCAIIFSGPTKKDLRANLCVGTYKYFSHVLSYEKKSNDPEFFDYLKPSNGDIAARFFYRSIQKNKKNNQFCYVVVAINKPDYEIQLLQNLVDGKIDICRGARFESAFDTEDEAINFLLNKDKKCAGTTQPDTNNYWVFKINGNKDKVIQLIRLSQDDYLALDYGVRVTNKIESAFNIDKSAILVKTPVNTEKEITCDEIIGKAFLL